MESRRRGVSSGKLKGHELELFKILFTYCEHLVLESPNRAFIRDLNLLKTIGWVSSPRKNHTPMSQLQVTLLVMTCPVVGVVEEDKVIPMFKKRKSGSACGR